ncbi:actin-like ATPase domain-containing protein [Wilcoxina mikolae CBS 423.85]|nr:actin-like ATPase domain-containing protein [Wilcoxina mikolae CBS 423.85]
MNLSGIAAGTSNGFTTPANNPSEITAAKLGKLGLTPVTVITDFLEGVKNTTLARIKGTYPADLVRDTKVEYVLTVPAIWSDSAKDLMVEAAQAAGLGTHRVDFDLISEPEAAASYTLKVMQSHNLKIGDTFVVCDAGGGTVDLISYTITNLDPLQINEIAPGTGDMCGSVFLDMRFEEYIRYASPCSQRSKKQMILSWEDNVKFKFGNEASEEYEVSLPGVPDDPYKKIEDDFHTIQPNEVQKIFDPIVDCIIKLVKQQVDEVKQKGEKVAAILLVGGFGSSPYLLERLETAAFSPGTLIEVLSPPEPRHAVARGALLRGLEGTIVRERRARINYGCSAVVPYVPGEGLEDHICWQRASDEFVVDGHMDWYIQRDTLSTSISFYRMVPVPSGRYARPSLVFHDDLLAYNYDDPPDYSWRIPGAVYCVCTLRSDLSSIPCNKFPKVANSEGLLFYRVEFELRMTLISEVLKFELLFDGEPYGAVTSKFQRN